MIRNVLPDREPPYSITPGRLQSQRICERSSSAAEFDTLISACKPDVQS